MKKYRAYRLRAPLKDPLKFGVYELGENEVPIVPPISKHLSMEDAIKEAERLNDGGE